MLEVRNGCQHYRKKCLKQKLPLCNVCGQADFIFSLVVHHIDGNRDNNDLDNLIPLCRSCHSKVHNTERYGGRIDELSEQLNSEVVELPEDVVEIGRSVRDNTSATSISEGIQMACREGGFDV